MSSKAYLVLVVILFVWKAARRRIAPRFRILAIQTASLEIGSWKGVRHPSKLKRAFLPLGKDAS